MDSKVVTNDTLNLSKLTMIERLDYCGELLDSLKIDDAVEILLENKDEILLKNDYTELAKYFLLQARISFRKLQIEEADRLFKVAVKNAEQTNNEKLTGQVLLTQVSFLVSQARYEESLPILELINDKYKLLFIDDHVVYFYVTLANCYQNTGNKAKALNYFKVALENVNRVKNQTLLSSIYNDVAGFFFHIGYYEKALDVLQFAIRMQGKDQLSSITKIRFYLNLCSIYIHSNNIDLSEEYYDLANAEIQMHPGVHTEYKIKALQSKGDIHRLKNQYQEAVEAYDEALSIVKEANSSNSLPSILLNKSIAILKSNSLPEKIIVAEQTLNEIEPLVFQRLNQLEISQFFSALAQLQNLKHEYDKSEKSFLLSLKYSQEWFKEMLKLGVDSVSYAVEFETSRIEQQVTHAKNVELDEINQQLRGALDRVEKQHEELNQFNLELQRKNFELETIQNERSSFLDIAAHHLKSPLFEVQILVEELLDELKSKDNYVVEKLEKVHVLSSSMFGQVNSILQANYVDQNKENFEVREVDISKIIYRVVSDHQWSVNKKNQILDVSISAATTKLFQMEFALQCIIDNLLSNAIKYSPPSSRIQLHLKKRDASSFELQIKDSGPGFTDEDEKSLYQKFKKLSAKPTGTESQTGLGLSIVKTLAIASKCTIDLETDTSGSVFSVVIPGLRKFV